MHSVTIYVAQKDIPTVFDELPKESLERLAAQWDEVKAIEDEEDRAVATVTRILGFLVSNHRVWCIENDIKPPTMRYETVIHPTTDIAQGWRLIYEFDRAEDAARFDQTFG